MGRTCSTYGEDGSTYIILVRKIERKILFGKPKRRWDCYIKMGIKQIGC
jgi:hypothetical protein